MRRVLAGATGSEQAALWIKWVGDKLGEWFDPEVCKVIAVIDHSRIRGACVFDRFTDGDCVIHMASDGSGTWASKRFIHEVFAYPFIQLRQRRVTALVKSRNTHALQLDLKLGFQREGVLRMGASDDDLVVLGMLKSECRFITAHYIDKVKAGKNG